MPIAHSLLHGTASIGVCGLGFIGTTTALHYANMGVRVIGYDVDRRKVDLYKQGACNVINLEEWSGLRLTPYVESEMIRPTDSFGDLSLCPIIFVAVPTEKDGRPFKGYVDGLVKKLRELPQEPFIVIESTMAPSWAGALGLASGKSVIAPRRDWFSDPNWSMRNMPRIWWTPPEYREEIEEVLSIVCNKLIYAPNAESASLTKAVENALLHAEIAFYQQLSMEFVPRKVDVNWVARAVGTHPRLPTRYPGIKVGGYCVALGSEYVSEGSTLMTISQEALRTNNTTVLEVARAVKRFEKIGILGITYKNDLKIHTLSAALDFVRLLRGKICAAHDPYYSPKEIQNILGIDCSFLYPDALGEFDCLLIVTDHKMYMSTPLWKLKQVLRKDVAIVDNLGVWERWKEEFPGYRRFGTDELVW